MSRLFIQAAPSCPELPRGELGVRTETFCSSVKERHAQVIPETVLGCSPGMYYSGSQKHLQLEDMLEFMRKTYLSGFLSVHILRVIVFSLGCTRESSGEIWSNPNGQPHPEQLYQNLRRWVPGRWTFLKLPWRFQCAVKFEKYCIRGGTVRSMDLRLRSWEGWKCSQLCWLVESIPDFQGNYLMSTENWSQFSS